MDSQRTSFIIFFIQLLILVNHSSQAQNTNGLIDAAGDIAFVAYHTDDGSSGEEDGFSFVLLDRAPVGTQIRFIDEEWNGTSFGQGEGDLLWENDTESTIEAGTIISIYDADGPTESASLGRVEEIDLGFNLASAEDLAAIVGTRDTPEVFLAATDGRDSRDFNLSGTGLSVSHVLFFSGEGKYDGSNVCLESIDECLLQIHDTERNWVYGDYIHEGQIIESFTGDTFHSCSSPNDQVSDIHFQSLNDSSITLVSFSSPSDGADGYVIYVNDSNSFFAPEQTEELLPELQWLSSGQQVIYTGASISPEVTITGLSSGTSYYFHIYAYNNCQGLKLFETSGLGTMVKAGRTELTISGLRGQNKVYDGKREAHVTGQAEILGLLGSDEVLLEGNPTFTFTSAEVGSDVNIELSGYTLTGADAHKYTLIAPVLSADITKKSLSISNLSGVTKMYDGNQEAEVQGEAKLIGIIGEDQVALEGQPIFTFISSDVDNDIPITTAGYVLSGEDSANYKWTPPLLSANIIAKCLTVTTLDTEKVYGEANPDFIVNYTGFVDGEDMTALASPIEVRTTADTFSTVGIYELILSGGSARNYELDLKNASLTISKAPLAVAAEAQQKTYGDQDPSFTYQIVSGSLIGNDSLSGTLSRVAGQEVGFYDIVQGSLSAGVNYDMTYQGADLTINKALLTIKPDDINKVYGEDNPLFTIRYTGFVAGEDTTAITTPQVKTVADRFSPVGVYELVLDGGSSRNYELDFVKASLNITKAPLTILAGVQTKTYGQPDPDLSYEITAGSLIGTDSISGRLDRVPGEDVGKYMINLNSLSAGDNYELTFEEAEMTIHPLSLSIVDLNVEDKTYDGTTVANVSGGRLTGLINQDKVFISNIPEYSFLNERVARDVDLTTSGYFVLSGEDATNYRLIQPSGLKANIMPRSLFVSGLIANHKEYDGNSLASVTGKAFLEGIVGSDDVILEGNPTFNFVSVQPAQGITIETIGYCIRGFDAGNYHLIQPKLSADIIDSTAPNVVLKADLDSVVNSLFTLEVLFDEKVTGFDMSDISVINGSPSQLIERTAGIHFEVDIIPALDDEVIIQIYAGKVKDMLGNQNESSNVISTFFDSTRPVVSSITKTDRDQINNDDNDADYTVVFSEPVSGVDATDFEIVSTGTARGRVNSVIQIDHTTFMVHVDSISGQGTVQLNAEADGTIVDQASNIMIADHIGDFYTINWIPTQISLNNSSVAENAPSGTIVGELQTLDQDIDDIHTYELLSETDSTDNDLFYLEGTILKTAEVFDFETKASYRIKVSTADGNGGLYEQFIEITIDNELEPSLKVEGSGYFDDTYLGSNDAQVWQLMNDGEMAIEVSMSSIAEGFTLIPQTLVLDVGETKEVEVVFTPTEAREYIGEVSLSYAKQYLSVNVYGLGVIIAGRSNTILEEELLSIYPNPVSDWLTIDLSALTDQTVDVIISDIDGREILSWSSLRQSILELDLSEFRGGVYMLSIHNEFNKVVKKVLVGK